jgi:DNA (cytosine-5)-methyltransferase 1
VTAYYNEIDPKAAAWLRELIKAGHIAPGEVDERSIVDVRPSELAGFVQCHFFAGIGVWSYALRRAGWSDSRPVWTGSCPCQPFSAAGKGGGFADERHLWPHWFHLIGECRPAIVFGEQVASKDADVWIDLVQTDLEALGYAFGAVPFPSAGIGAPNIRDRMYWVGVGQADANGERLQGRSEDDLQRARWRQEGRAIGCGDGASVVGLADTQHAIGRTQRSIDGEAYGGNGFGRCCDVSRLANSIEGERGRRPAHGRGNEFDVAKIERDQNTGDVERVGNVRWLADTDGGNASAEWIQRGWQHGQWAQDGLSGRPGDQGVEHRADTGLRTSPTNGFWSNPDWLFCRDGKWRPVESGTFPLAHGAAARVGRLRGYGNAINAEAAIAFIEAATAHEIVDLEAA